ncbi:MAG: glycosyltransferase family 4 protein [Pseudomonadota bacterium]
MKLLYLVTEDWYFCSHRMGLAMAAQNAGFDVVVVTRVSDQGERIRQAGFRLVDLPASRRSLNPLAELRVLWRLRSIYRDERPDIVHHIALKPVIYGSLATRLVGPRRVVNTFAGMGWIYSSRRVVPTLLRYLVQVALRRLLRQGQVVVQNRDDADLVRALGGRCVHLIPGSGVPVERFRPVARRRRVPVVVLVARLIWEKGVREFVEASRILYARGVQARFVLVGSIDRESRGGIPEEALCAWQRQGVIEWWGQREDMPEVLAQADIACLPSYYREGIPMTLLEAAASGLAIVTTDTPGCREVVSEGDNGRLVPARAVAELADALHELIGNECLRRRMGERSRAMAVERFAEEQVVAASLAVYQAAIQEESELSQGLGRPRGVA